MPLPAGPEQMSLPTQMVQRDVNILGQSPACTLPTGSDARLRCVCQPARRSESAPV